MAISQLKHFWTWFRRNNTTLLTIPVMEKKEKEYWVQEMATHLKACTKKLSCFVPSYIGFHEISTVTVNEKGQITNL